MSQSVPVFKIGDTIYDTNFGTSGQIVEVLSKDYRVKTVNKIFHLIPHESAAEVPASLLPASTISPSAPPPSYQRAGSSMNIQMSGWNTSSGAKFKPGDTVRNKVTGFKGEIRSVDELVIDDYTYWTWYPDESIARYTKEADLELMTSTPSWGPKCNCGAKFTSNANLHSRWCDRFGRD